MSLVLSVSDLVSGVCEKTCSGSAEGVAGSCGMLTSAGGGRDGMGNLIGTTRFFFSGATVLSVSDSVFFRPPLVADFMIFFGDTKSSFLLFSSRGFRGSMFVDSVPGLCFVDAASFSLRRCLESLMVAGLSDIKLPLVLSLSAKPFATWLSLFSSPNFRLEPAFKT